MVNKNIKKGIIVGVCMAVIASANVTTCGYAYDKNIIKNQTTTVPITSASVDMLNETLKETEPISANIQVFETGCKINFSTIGSYSVYQKGIQAIDIKGWSKSNVCLVNEMVDKDIYLGGEILNTSVDINNLKPATKYHLYAYKNQEPIQSALIQEFDIVTKPEAVYLEEVTKTSNSIEITWNAANNAVCYDIYRDDELIDTVTETEYTDNNLDANTTYSYQVKARYDIEEINNYSVFSNGIQIETEAPPVTVHFDVENSSGLGLPSVSGECKTWANYTAVKAKSSPQYKLLNSESCYTDTETGIRMVDDCYCVALGSYYGSTIGQKYLIKLSSGNEFKAILCDQKSDRHTDANHQYAVKNKDIVEFYIDRQYKPAAVGGSYGVLSQFSGAIVSIEKIA